MGTFPAHPRWLEVHFPTLPPPLLPAPTPPHTQMHTSTHALGFPITAFVQRAVTISSPTENLSVLTTSSLRAGGMSHSLWQPQHLMQSQAFLGARSTVVESWGVVTSDGGWKTPHGVNLLSEAALRVGGSTS